MEKNELLQEQYEDVLFAMLMKEVVAAEGEELLEKCKRLQEDPDAAVPDHVVQRGLKTIRKRFRKEAAEKFWRVTSKVASRVAVVFLVLALTFTTAFAASPKFRVSALNFVAGVFNEHISFSTEKTDAEITQVVSAGWLPEGYEQISYEEQEKRVKVIFDTAEGQSISVDIYDASENLVLDTESAEVGTALVNGYEATTITKRGIDGYGNTYERCSVIWVDTVRGWIVVVKSHDEKVETLVRVGNALQLR